MTNKKEQKPKINPDKQSKLLSWILWVIILIAVALILIFVVFKPFEGDGQYADFAKCLTSKHVIMYGTNWCSVCREQKSLFGASFKFIDFRNCDNRKEECDAMGILSIPAWLINGTKNIGLHTLDELSELTGCKLQTA